MSATGHELFSNMLQKPHIRLVDIKYILPPELRDLWS
jgi:hypothetical protein